jgi:hypothetical protein
VLYSALLGNLWELAARCAVYSDPSSNDTVPPYGKRTTQTSRTRDQRAGESIPEHAVRVGIAAAH